MNPEPASEHYDNSITTVLQEAIAEEFMEQVEKAFETIQ